MIEKRAPAMATYGRLAKVGVLWSAFGRGFGELIALPASMVLARLLSPHDFGVVAAANFFVQLAQRLTNFGFNTALVQREKLTPEHTCTVWLFNLIVGAGMWAALALTAPFLGAVFRSQEVASTLPITGVAFLVSAFGTVPQAIMAREMRFRAGVAVDAVYAVATAVLAVWFAWAGYGFWSLIWSQLIASVLQTVLRFLVSGWLPSWSFSWASLRELLSLGIGLHFRRLLDSAALNVDNLVVARMLGLTSLGFYDKGFTMMNRALNFWNAASYGVSFRIFAIIHRDRERFRLAYRKVLLAATFVSYPAWALLALMGPELFYVMFGRQWDSAVAPFQVLCGVGALKTLTLFVSSATQGVGQVWGEVQRQVVYLALIVIGVIVGSPWGLVGAAAGVLIATLIMSVLMQHLLQKVTALSWRDLVEPQWPAVLCATTLVTVLTLLRALVAHGPARTPGQALARMAVSGLATGALYLGTVRFSRSRELADVFEEIVTDMAPWLGSWIGSRPGPK